jgi:hypothetical protein
MAQGASNVNVEITGSVDGLDSAMEKATSATRTAADGMTRDTEKMSSAFEGMGHRFEHSGVMIAFAVNSMMDGTQTGVTRALHSIAMLGFAFGPVVGSVTTAVALILEQLDTLVKESGTKLKAFTKSLEDAANAGHTAELLRQRQDLLVGTPSEFVANPSGRVIGAATGSLEDLRAKAADAKAAVQPLEGGLKGMVDDWKRFSADRTLNSQLDLAEGKLKAIDAALRAAHIGASDAPDNKPKGPAHPGVSEEEEAQIESTMRTMNLKWEAARKYNEQVKRAQEETTALSYKLDAESGKFLDKILDDSIKATNAAATKKRDTEERTAKEAREVALAANKSLNEDIAAGGKRIGDLMNKIAQGSEQEWTTRFDRINNAFSTAIEKMKQKGGTFGEFMRNIGHQLMSDFIQSEIKMTEAKLTELATRKTMTEADAATSKALHLSSTLSTITSNAASAASATYAGVMNTLGLVLGPAAIPIAGALAGGAFVAVEAFGALASAAKGFDIPRGMNPVTQLHSEEMVLPAHLANAVRGMAAGGGSGGGTVHVHIQAMDSQGVAQWAKSNQGAIGRAALAHMRNSPSMPSAAGRSA